jgi:hypothetical protein
LRNLDSALRASQFFAEAGHESRPLKLFANFIVFVRALTGSVRLACGHQIFRRLFYPHTGFPYPTDVRPADLKSVHTRAKALYRDP